MTSDEAEACAFAFFVDVVYEEHLKRHPEETIVPSTLTDKCHERWMALKRNEKKKFYASSKAEYTRYEVRRLAFAVAKDLIAKSTTGGASVFLYVPNLIGYFRILLLLPCVFGSDGDFLFVCYLASVLLDYFDGYFARKLRQTSAFGAWLDVVIDNIGRGAIWQRASEYGYLLSSLEWLTFVSLHAVGAHWKREAASRQTVHPPWLIRKMTVNEFRNPLGIFVIGSVHILPIIAYCHAHSAVLASIKFIRSFLFVDVMPMGLIVFSFGRFLAFMCECWVNYLHIRDLACFR